MRILVSDSIKKGVEKAPHRSLLYALGLTYEEIKRPIIGVANSKTKLYQDIFTLIK